MEQVDAIVAALGGKASEDSETLERAQAMREQILAEWDDFAA